MVGQTVLHYRIVEKLGEGGMGVVYKAHDTKLDRSVAVKFLPHQVTSDKAEQSRFLQEARAAAALNHPNVCSVIDIEEADGQQFIVMEYVDGVTLRRKAPVAKIDEALGYAIQIGEALQAAHSRGIVHRDVKSENVMVTADGRVKVMDFGLAKLAGVLQTVRTSSTVGTLAYMAPEQIQGGDADARSDIFSFGVVLFELLTGKLPFRGEHEAATMYSIINDVPHSVLTHRPDAPPEVDRIIGRALEKDPADRYQHVDDMVSELRRLRKHSGPVSRPTPPAADPSQVPVKRSMPSKKVLALGIGALVVLSAIAFFLVRDGSSQGTTSRTDRKMLVVLPFENLGKSEQEYFADGISEEITSKLSGLSGLGVIARQSAMQYKKTSKPLKEIAEELHVDYILQGTLRWETDGGTTRVRVNPQLISVMDGTQIWSEPSEAVWSSAFKLQSEIATRVAEALNVTLLQHERRSLQAGLTENAEAYDAYLRGKEYVNHSWEERGYRIAEQMFRQAVELDPQFAEAYAQLAGTHAAIYWEYYDHTPERTEKSRVAAEKALQIAPNLPDAHMAMGWYLYHCRLDYENALREFNIGLETQPDNVDLLMGVASIDRRQGKFESAIEHFNRVIEIDPRSPLWLAEVAATYLPLRRYEEAERFLNRGITIAPDVAENYYTKGFLYAMWDGNISKAREAFDQARQRKVGEFDAAFLYFTLMIDMLDGKYQQVIDRLESSAVKVFDYQYWYVPKELVMGRTHDLLGRSGQGRRYYEAARQILEREAREHPDDARIHSSLGIAYASLGRKEDALREGQRGMDLLPISKDALVGPRRLRDFAEIQTIVGEHDAAIDNLKTLLSIPSHVSVPWLRIDPVWNPLRANPRFQKLLAGAL